MAAENHYDRAFEIIQDLVTNQKLQADKKINCISLRDKIRMIVETLMFFWFMPRKRWLKKSN